MNSDTIAFIGAGNMASCLIGGLITNGYASEKIWVSDPNPDKLLRLQQQFQLQITDDNQQAAEAADIIVLAVKPKVMPAVCKALVNVDKKTLMISIAAGVREETIQAWFGHAAAIVRCMPNTPALVGCGATALHANDLVSATQKDQAESILRSVGVTVWLDHEAQLDTVTALSGSGPAYFLTLMAALQQAAIDQGLPHDTAKLLTLQTALGTAEIAMRTQTDCNLLRQQVTSPGGTTEAAMNILHDGKVEELFAAALLAAKNRAQAIADEIAKEE